MREAGGLPRAAEGLVLGRLGLPKAGPHASDASWATVLTKASWARSKEGKRGKRNPFAISKEFTKLEFKHKFEFKQIKTMQQHECNSKLL
jgi:hypothetical protein